MTSARGACLDRLVLAMLAVFIGPDVGCTRSLWGSFRAKAFKRSIAWALGTTRTDSTADAGRGPANRARGIISTYRRYKTLQGLRKRSRKRSGRLVLLSCCLMKLRR